MNNVSFCCCMIVIIILSGWETMFMTYGHDQFEICMIEVSCSNDHTVWVSRQLFVDDGDENIFAYYFGYYYGIKTNRNDGQNYKHSTPVLFKYN